MNSMANPLESALSSSSTTEGVHTSSKPSGAKGRKKRDQRRLEAVVDQIDDHIANGRFYEAEQCHKSIFNRFARQGFLERIASICEAGALQLLEMNQGGSGGEVALLYLKSIVAGKIPVTQERLDAIVDISGRFPEDSLQAQVDYVKKAISWSAEFGDDPRGSPFLHSHLATLLASAQDVGGAHKHFLRAQNPEGHAQFLAPWLRSPEVVQNEEQDLIILRCVLEYLNLKDLDGARRFLREAENILPMLTSPLTNFTTLLLEAIDRGAPPPFQMLLTKYKSHLERDESFAKMLDKVGQEYFKLAPTTESVVGGLMDLLK